MTRPDPRASTATATPARVLVVDDSTLARAVIVRHLTAEGHDLRQAASGEEALAACAQAPPDVVLMDVEMPGIDGYETLRRLKEQPGLDDVPVIFLTGRTDAADVAEALRIGAHDYLRGDGLRQEDVLARWGGEEFVVLAADTDAAGIAGLANRMRRAVEAAPIVVDAEELTVTVSAGWATGHGGIPFDTLIRAADGALYDAKAAGRNTVRGIELPRA